MSAVGPTVAEEMLEVCDEHNQVTGLVKRGVVHKEGLRHRAVNVLLFTPDGKLLLQRRSAAKDVCPNRCGAAAATRHAVTHGPLVPGWAGGT